MGTTDGPHRTEELVLAALTAVADLEPRRYEPEHDVAKRVLDVVRLEQAAERRGLTSLRMSPDVRIFRDESRALGFHKNMSSSLRFLDRAVTNRKPLTKRILRAAGLPLTREVVAADEAQVAAAVDVLGAPVVVKPVTGSGGRGVRLDLRSAAEAVEAAAPLLDEGRPVLVEEMVSGVDLRVTVVDGRTVAATLRVPSNVVGDGSSTIEQLVAAKNELRRTNDYARHQRVAITAAVEQFLAGRGLSAASVPGPGERVFLHYVANISAGGDSYEVLDMLHPQVAALAEAATACFPSSRHAGIDILLERFDAPLDGQRAVVCEVNLNNELPLHLYPLYGPSSPVDEAVLDAYWPAEASIPTEVLDSDSAPAAVPVELAELRVLAAPDATSVDPPSGDAAEAQSATQLDDALLREAVAGLAGDGHEVRTSPDGRLLHLLGPDGEQVAERTGRTVLAGIVGGDAGVTHRYARTAGIPVAARHWLRSGDEEKAAKLAGRRWRRWLLHLPGPEDGTVAVPVASEAELRAAWPREDVGRFRMVEAPTGTACVLLVAGDRLLAAQLREPLTVRGDGRRELGTLLAEALGERRDNPVLRHVAGELDAETLLAEAGLDPASVPGGGEPVAIGDSPNPSAGAATVGLDELPWPGLAAQAARLQAAVGNPGVASLTFVPRRRSAADATWALWRYQSEPWLALFRFPLRGRAADPYPELASRLLAGPRRPLAPERAV